MTDFIQPSEPLVAPEQTVRDEWTDYNGHLNMAYYHVLFDQALDSVLDRIGMGAERARRDGLSVFTAEAHVHYLQELNAGDRVQVSLQVLGADAKRLHYVQTMRRVGAGGDKAEDGFVAAITENLILHADLSTRRVAPWAPDVAQRWTDLARAHQSMPVPPQVGRVMGLRRPAQA
ncbi:thioesterase family protein [uncultured Paracoccus sp.]|uniref:thioesterase family protein n=1 Tax=uncultured Paracoccus sp. TaxID=189685 RepID=UPI0026369806|nr:thioesterase family protein [uncultured Paracoccus sp.]